MVITVWKKTSTYHFTLEVEIFIKLLVWVMQASFTANCVFNALLCFTAITINIVTILALRKPLTIPRALKTLLLSLAVSDLGVGLLVQPLYISILVMLIKENPQIRTFEITQNIFYSVGNFLTYASFLGVVALSADRSLAVHFYLRYQELVTHKRVVAVVISILIISAILMLLFICCHVYFSTCWKRLLPNYSLLLFQGLLSCTSPQQSIHVLQAQLAQNNEGDMANAARERKSAVGTFYVYLVFLICYLPSTCYWIIHRSAGPSMMLFQTPSTRRRL